MQEQPLHWDNHRTNLNLTFIFALIVAVIGILGQPVLFVLGIGVAIYSWLTNPKQYLIYRDALVIIYGRPRIKSYPFQEISHLETLSLPIGERLRVRMVNGRRIMLLPKDSDTFRAKLDEALDAFHGEQKTEAHAGHGIAHNLPLLVLIVAMGVYPKPVIERMEPSVDALVAHIETHVDGFHEPTSRFGADIEGGEGGGDAGDGH